MARLRAQLPADHHLVVCWRFIDNHPSLCVFVCACPGSFAIMQVSGTAAVLPAQGNQGYCVGFQPYLPVLNCPSGRILVNNLGAA